MRVYLLVALGGALGSAGRFWLANFLSERLASGFPWGTLLINVTGSFAIVLFAGLTEVGTSGMVPDEWRQFFMVGICGGYTTFSAFSFQTLNLLRDEKFGLACLYIAGSVILCLLAAWLGLVLASALNHARNR